jgi:hypothetical protein
MSTIATTTIEHPITGKSIVVRLDEATFARLANKFGRKSPPTTQMVAANFIELNPQITTDKPEIRSTL